MKIILKIVLIGLAMFSFVGCGSSSKSANVSAKDLKGEWIGTCETNGTTSSRTDLNFVDDTVKIRDIKFNDPICSDNVIFSDLNRNFQYVLGEDMKTVDNFDVTKIDITFLGLVSAPIGEFTDDLKYGSHLYSIVFEKDKKLYMGEISKTDSVNKLNFTAPFSRKK